MLTIIRGEDKTFQATFRNESCGGVPGDPFDLTGATEIKFFFPGETVTQSIGLVATEVSILSATLGKVQGTISDTKSALLKVGEGQTFEASIEFGTNKKKVKFVEQLTVESSIG
jgi:hypothetical protein